MRKKWIIVAAVGEKGVAYGNNHNMPMPLVEFVSSAKADSWTLTTGGAIAYFVHSARTPERLERFFAAAEALRGSLPLLGIGVACVCSTSQFDWFRRLKKNFKIDSQAENRALSGIQGAQTYRQIFDELDDQRP